MVSPLLRFKLLSLSKFNNLSHVTCKFGYLSFNEDNVSTPALSEVFPLLHSSIVNGPETLPVFGVSKAKFSFPKSECLSHNSTSRGRLPAPLLDALRQLTHSTLILS